MINGPLPKFHGTRDNLYIGEERPSRWDEIDAIRAEGNPVAYGGKPRPRITP
jgi:hypothetical protein